ncbi:FecR family protein [Mesonia sp. K7]|uniref:FecR family protein n=1 Tax=Mesonia sp. K7 TaxID=2218606 RepID=UPI000DA705FF|nr:FecR family protein [Mesonia sp. K7]PZD79213.1 iron dicitrate transport regulator FecR [Mesonia sp. K7]
MKKEEFIQLTEKYAQGNCAPNEIKIVESFFEAQQELAIVPMLSPVESKKLYQKIQNQLPLPKKRTKIYPKVAAIAAVVLICFLGYRFLTPTQLITQIAQKGEKKQIVLQDGSVVMLNANSSITYPKDFTTNRNIRLTGQAFFQVTRDKSSPFIVKTNQMEVEVLGTSFDVNTNTHQKPTVSVVSGVVRVSEMNNKQHQVVLHKNEQASLLNQQLVYHKTNAKDDIAWTKNVILLQNHTLKETAEILENWYDIQIDFENETLEELTISGKYKNEKIENIMQSIALLKNLHIDTLTSKHLLIRANKI